jgi:hypothetical protein
MRFFPVVNHWIHLVSAILWVGGLAFQVFVFFPVLQKKKLLSEAMARAITDRFRLIVGPLVILLIVTGGINIHSRRLAAKALAPECGTDGQPECIPAGYTSALSLKLLFVVGIISIYLFDVMVSRRQAEPKELPPDGVPPPTRISLILGILVIFMAAMLRHWRF